MTKIKQAISFSTFQTKKLTKPCDTVVEFNLWLGNIFAGKPCTKCGGKTSPILAYKTPKLDISLDQESEVIRMLWRFFLLYVQLKVYEDLSKLKSWPLAAFTWYKVFYKIIRGLKLVSLHHFQYEKNLSRYVLLSD